MSFVGATWHGDRSVRLKVVSQCKALGSPICEMKEFRDCKSAMRIKQSSTFCLEPAGDSPDRKSVSDDVAAGCIPVFFSSQSYALTPWYWNSSGEDGADGVGRVLIDRTGFLKGSVSLKSALMGISTAAIDRAQQRLARIAFGFQYSTDETHDDAVDIMMRGLKREADACAESVGRIASREEFSMGAARLPSEPQEPTSLAHIDSVAGTIPPPTVAPDESTSVPWYVAHIDELFRTYRCEHLYIDAGTNIGVQIRKLYEPDKYPPLKGRYRERSATFWYKRNFGDMPGRCRVCTIGFEPNPMHAKRLDTLQSTYRKVGIGVLILHAAVAAHEHNLTFNPGGKRYGPSRIDGKVITEDTGYRCIACPLYTVPAVRLATVLHHVKRWLSQTSRKARVLMKMDIEGSEFETLPDVIHTPAHFVPSEGADNLATLPADYRHAIFGPLCIVDEMVIEWHAKHLNSSHAEAQARAHHMTSWYGTTLNGSMPRTCPTTILATGDDESYLNDGPKLSAPNCPVT